jgi:hypothetical protein
MTAIRQLPLDDLDGLDLLPLACVEYALDRIGKTNGIRFEQDLDDLDCYDISALEFDNTANPPARPLIFALRAYRGGPRGAVDILLPAELRESPVLRSVVRNIAWALHIPFGRIKWPETSDESGQRDRQRHAS